MIWYLLWKFQKVEEENKENVKLVLKHLGLKFYLIFIPIFIVFTVLNFVALVYDNFILSSIGYFAVIIFSVLIIKVINKKTIENVDKELELYKSKLELLKKILEGMNLNSKNKIKNLIELINFQKSQCKHSATITKIFSIIISSLLIPTLTLFLKWLFDYAKTINQVIMYIGIIVVAILSILGIFFMIVPFIVNKIDKDFNEFNRLQSMLEDLYLTDYIDINHE